MKDFDFLVPDDIYKRLSKWVSFFNSNYSSISSIYSKTIYSLFSAAKHNQLFRTQTTFEFEVSLSFYHKALNSNVYFYFLNIEESLYFLNVSLIYGCYSGMVINSVYKAFENYSKFSNINGLHLMFKTLFVKYQTPSIFIKNLNALSKTEIEALMFIIQGNNIRLFEKTPFKISKKESFLFTYNLPSDFYFKDNILERALVCSKLLLHSKNSNLLNLLLKKSKLFQFKLFTFYDDIEFWKKVLNLLEQEHWTEDYENPFIPNYLGIQEYIDFFEFKRYYSEEKYQIKGRTINSITRSVFEWHETNKHEKLLKKINLKWIGTDSIPMKIEHENSLFVIKEITNGKELFRESDYMKHCVFQYIENCAMGYISVWSLSKKIDSVYIPFITIEVCKKAIVQAAGKRNRRITHSELILITEWARIMNYSIQLFNQ